MNVIAVTNMSQTLDVTSHAMYSPRGGGICQISSNTARFYMQRAYSFTNPATYRSVGRLYVCSLHVGPYHNFKASVF